MDVDQLVRQHLPLEALRSQLLEKLSSSPVSCPSLPSENEQNSTHNSSTHKKDLLSLVDPEDQFAEEALADIVQTVTDEPLLSRFFRKHKYNYDGALMALERHLAMRLSTGLAKTLRSPLSEEVREVLSRGFFYLCHGVKDEGRPVACLNFAHFPAGADVAVLTSACQIQFELLTRSLRRAAKEFTESNDVMSNNVEDQSADGDGVVVVDSKKEEKCENDEETCTTIAAMGHSGQVTLVVNLEQFSLANLSVDFITTMRDILTLHYPSLFARVYVLNYRWMHAGVWGFIKRMVSPEACSRVSFIEPHQLSQHLSRSDIAFDSEKFNQFLDEFGVKHKFDEEHLSMAKDAIDNISNFSRASGKEQEGLKRVDSKLIGEEDIIEQVSSDPPSDVREIPDANGDSSVKSLQTLQTKPFKFDLDLDAMYKRLLRVLLKVVLQLAPSMEKLSVLISRIQAYTVQLRKASIRLALSAKQDATNHSIAFLITCASTFTRMLMGFQRNWSFLLILLQQRANAAKLLTRDVLTSTSTVVSENFHAASDNLRVKSREVSEAVASAMHQMQREVHALPSATVIKDKIVELWRVSKLEIDWREAVLMMSAGMVSAVVVAGAIGWVKK